MTPPNPKEPLDLDAIEALATEVLVTGWGHEYPNANVARLICTDVPKLIARVQELESILDEVHPSWNPKKNGI